MNDDLVRRGERFVEWSKNGLTSSKVEFILRRAEGEGEVGMIGGRRGGRGSKPRHASLSVMYCLPSNLCCHGKNKALVCM